jgi:hypothetical protein
VLIDQKLCFYLSKQSELCNGKGDFSGQIRLKLRPVTVKQGWSHPAFAYKSLCEEEETNTMSNECSMLYWHNYSEFRDVM